MSSSSSERIRFDRPLAGARLAVHDGAAGVRKRGTNFDLKEIQRRAFDRGVAVEREKGSRAMAKVCAALEEEQARQAQTLANDHRRLEEFAVRLAMIAARKLAFSQVAAGEHDVLGMVQQLVSELGPRPTDGKVTVRLAPSDHVMVLESERRSELDLAGVEAVADAALDPGDAVLESGSVEYWSSLEDRAERLWHEMIAEARDA